MRLSPEAIALLEAAKARILADPERYDQSTWHCGSACCIAGHVAICAGAIEVPQEGKSSPQPMWRGVLRDWMDWGHVASEALGLSDQQTLSLFSGEPTDDWPEPFKTEWLSNCKYDDEWAEVGEVISSAVAADIAARRIDHFIATGE